MMKKAKAYLVLLLLTLCTACGQGSGGSNWTKFYEKDNDAYFIDTNGIFASGEIVTAWRTVNLANPKLHENKPYKSEKALLYIRCSDRSFLLKEVSAYDLKDGGGATVARIVNPDAKFADTAPDSEMRATLDFVCTHATKK